MKTIYHNFTGLSNFTSSDDIDYIAECGYRLRVPRDTNTIGLIEYTDECWKREEKNRCKRCVKTLNAMERRWNALRRKKNYKNIFVYQKP